MTAKCWFCGTTEENTHEFRCIGKITPDGKEPKKEPQSHRKPNIDLPFPSKYEHMTRDDLMYELEHREKLSHKMWGAITKHYGQDGFIKVLTSVDPNAFPKMPKFNKP